MNKAAIALVVSFSAFVFVIGIIFGGIVLPATDAIVVTKTETQTETATIVTMNEEACTVMFEWYQDYPNKPFSARIDRMYDEFIEVCG